MRQVFIGEDVVGSAGARLGAVERIVVDERGHRVTHLVVEGRAVPLSRFREASVSGLVTDLDEEQLRQLPSADLPPFGQPGEHWRAPFDYGVESFLSIFGALVGQAPYQPPVHAALGAEDRLHEITAGSPVWSGNCRLGEVQRVLTDDTGAVNGLVIREDHLAGRRLLVPAARVAEVVGNNVHVALSEAEERTLPPYEEDAEA